MYDPIVKIYALIDPFTKKIRYIGKTIMPLKKRLRYHVLGRSNTDKSNWLKGIVAKGSYPIISEIDSIKNSEWPEAEKYWIKYYREFHGNLFNMLAGGGYIPKEPIKRKPHTEERKKQYSEFFKGNKYRLGTKDSEETKKRKSEACRNSYVIGTRPRTKPIASLSLMKSITQFTKDGVFIQNFDSITEAAKTLGLKRTAITENVRGANYSCGGYVFKYK